MSRKTKNDSRGAASLHTGDSRLFSSVFRPLGKGAGKAGQGQPVTAGATQKKARKPNSAKWVKPFFGPAILLFLINLVLGGPVEGQMTVRTDNTMDLEARIQELRRSDRLQLNRWSNKGGSAATSFYSDF